MLEAYFRNREIPLLEFAGGAATPLRFSDPASEHLATRRAAGLFDFSFMGCFGIAGRDSRRYLQYLQTRNLDLLAPGTIAYTLLLRADGSVLIDATIWMHGEEQFWLFTGRRADIGHLRLHASGFEVTIDDRSTRQAVLAVQGPRSCALLTALIEPGPLTALRYFRFVRAHLLGQPCWIGRLGYSGELGYEIIVDAGAAQSIWAELCTQGEPAGLVECGFGSADSLRIESGHILFANELVERVTPYELGLARLLSSAHEFIGADTLRRLRQERPRQRLIGLAIDPARSAPLAYRAAPAFRLTSQAWSPVFRRRLGLGFVAGSGHGTGSLVSALTGETGRIARLPFYDPMRNLPRRLPA